MALVQATLAELSAALQAVIAQAQDQRPITGKLFELMYNTGLRVGEVLDVTRWQSTDADSYMVTLQKGETNREIQQDAIPVGLGDYYQYHRPFELETYSSVNNTFKRLAPGLLFGGDTRRTTCHAFRYRFMKALSEGGMTLQDIAVEMGHMNFRNTAAYIQSEIWLGS